MKPIIQFKFTLGAWAVIILILIAALFVGAVTLEEFLKVMSIYSQTLLL